MKLSLPLRALASTSSNAAKHAPKKTSLSRILTSPSTTPLASLLKRLHMSPLPILSPSVQSINLVLAERNDHFGARHFVKEHLARIRYHNPNIPITIQKIPKSPNGRNWKAELEVSTSESKEKTSIDMQAKHSLTIMHDLLTSFGAQPPSSSAPLVFPEGYESEKSVSKDVWSPAGLVKRAPSLRPQLDIWEKQTQARLRATAAAAAATPAAKAKKSKVTTTADKNAKTKKPVGAKKPVDLFAVQAGNSARSVESRA